MDRFADGLMHNQSLDYCQGLQGYSACQSEIMFSSSQNYSQEQILYSCDCNPKTYKSLSISESFQNCPNITVFNFVLDSHRLKCVHFGSGYSQRGVKFKIASDTEDREFKD